MVPRKEQAVGPLCIDIRKKKLTVLDLCVCRSFPTVIFSVVINLIKETITRHIMFQNVVQTVKNKRLILKSIK